MVISSFEASQYSSLGSIRNSRLYIYLHSCFSVGIPALRGSRLYIALLGSSYYISRWFSISIKKLPFFSELSCLFMKSTDVSFNLIGGEFKIYIGWLGSTIFELEYSLRFQLLLCYFDGLFGFLFCFLERAVTIPVLVVILNSIFLGAFGGRFTMSTSFDTLVPFLNLLTFSVTIDSYVILNLAVLGGLTDAIEDLESIIFLYFSTIGSTLIDYYSNLSVGYYVIGFCGIDLHPSNDEYEKSCSSSVAFLFTWTECGSFQLLIVFFRDQRSKFTELKLAFNFMLFFFGDTSIKLTGSCDLFETKLL